MGVMIIGMALSLASGSPVFSAGNPAAPDPVVFTNSMELGDVRQAETWLDAGMPPDYMGSRIGSGLMIAAWEGKIELMRLFISRGADINRMNGNGETAIILAAWRGHLEAVKWLVERGARINAPDRKWSALHYAVFSGHGAVADYLIEQGADINARSTNGSSVLMMAVYEGHQDLARKLIEEQNVSAMFLTRGTPHTEAIMPLLEKHGVALVAPSTGAMLLHSPVNRYVFNVRSSYQREAAKAVAHLHTLGIDRIAVVHVDDSFGTDALEGANKGFSKANLKPVAVVKADRNKPDYPAIVPALAKATPQAILWFGSGTAVADGIKALRAAGSAAQVVTLSNNASAGFIKALGDASRGVIVTQVFPYEKSFSYGIEKEALELAKAKGQNEISPAILEDRKSVV